MVFYLPIYHSAMYAFKGGIFYHWIYIVGTKKDAKQYKYRLTARQQVNSTENDEKIVYTGQVRSIFETEKEVIKNHNALMIVKILAERLANKSKYFAVDIELVEKKEKFKDDEEESVTYDGEKRKQTASTGATKRLELKADKYIQKKKKVRFMAYEEMNAQIYYDSDLFWLV